MRTPFTQKIGHTHRALALNAWGVPITLPPGTRCHLVVGADGVKGDVWAVSDAALLARLCGNDHDPKYRYLWIDAAEIAVDGAPS